MHFYVLHACSVFMLYAYFVFVLPLYFHLQLLTFEIKSSLHCITLSNLLYWLIVSSGCDSREPCGLIEEILSLFPVLRTQFFDSPSLSEVFPQVFHQPSSLLVSGFSCFDLTDHAVLRSQKRVDHLGEFSADGDDGFGGPAHLGDVLLGLLQFAGDLSV